MVEDIVQAPPKTINMAHKNKYDVTLEFCITVELDPRLDDTDPEFETAVRNKLKEIIDSKFPSIDNYITDIEEIPNPEKMNNHE
jgi:hypothetical protein